MAAEKKSTRNGIYSDENATTAEKNAPPQTCDSYEQPVPPDGGWGWIVVFASFMIHVVTDGVVYSFGELFKVILDKFKEGAGKTSLIPSILVGTTLCSGPIASAFVNKFGCRPVTIAGSVIATLCILISIYATSIEMLMVTVGLGTGIGFGLIYLPAIVSVTCYFEKYRSVATGIGVCGSGFGTVIFAPVFKLCLDHFGLNGAFIMIAGVVLTCVFYGILLRPMPSTDKPLEEMKNIVMYSPENIPLTTVSAPEDDPFTNSPNGVRRYSIHGTSDLQTSQNSLGNHPASQYISQPSLMIKDLHHKSYSSLKSHHSGVMYRKDVFFTGSIKSIKDISKSNGYLHTPQIQPATIQSEKTDKKKYSCIPCSLECQDTISEMTDFSLFRDMIFVIFVASNFFTSIGYNLPYIFIPNMIGEKKLPSHWSSYLLQTIGAGNTAGRIILGYLSDSPTVNRLFVYNTCLTFCGIACIVNVFSASLVQYLIFAFAYGFSTGAFVGLTSVITVDLFGLDKLTNAFGMLLLFQGIASFLGPPIAGYLSERTGTFDSTFYLAGISIGISGFMLYFVPAIQKYVERQRSHRNSHPMKC